MLYMERVMFFMVYDVLLVLCILSGGGGSGGSLYVLSGMYRTLLMVFCIFMFKILLVCMWGVFLIYVGVLLMNFDGYVMYVMDLNDFVKKLFWYCM